MLPAITISQTTLEFHHIEIFWDNRNNVDWSIVILSISGIILNTGVPLANLKNGNFDEHIALLNRRHICSEK